MTVDRNVPLSSALTSALCPAGSGLQTARSSAPGPMNASTGSSTIASDYRRSAAASLGPNYLGVGKTR